MFVNKLLLAFVFYNNGKIIKAAYQASDLEAVNEVDNYATPRFSFLTWFKKLSCKFIAGFALVFIFIASNKKQSILLYQFYNKNIVWASGKVKKLP